MWQELQAAVPTAMLKIVGVWVEEVAALVHTTGWRRGDKEVGSCQVYATLNRAVSGSVQQMGYIESLFHLNGDHWLVILSGGSSSVLTWKCEAWKQLVYWCWNSCIQWCIIHTDWWIQKPSSPVSTHMFKNSVNLNQRAPEGALWSEYALCEMLWPLRD